MAHIHEKIDFTASVFVVHRNKVLLRLHEKYHIWLSVGGHIELDEDPNEAALREVKEEVGLDVMLWRGNQKLIYSDERNKQLIPPVALNRHHTSNEHEHIDHVYFASSETDVVVPENPADEWRWLTRDELSMMDLRHDVKFFAALALEELAS